MTGLGARRRAPARGCSTCRGRRRGRGATSSAPPLAGAPGRGPGRRRVDGHRAGPVRACSSLVLYVPVADRPARRPGVAPDVGGAGRRARRRVPRARRAAGPRRPAVPGARGRRSCSCRSASAWRSRRPRRSPPSATTSPGARSGGASRSACWPSRPWSSASCRRCSRSPTAPGTRRGRASTRPSRARCRRPSTVGDYRVLYLGDPRLIPFPSDDLGDGVAMAVVDDGRTDSRDRWAVADGAGRRRPARRRAPDRRRRHAARRPAARAVRHPVRRRAGRSTAPTRRRRTTAARARRPGRGPRRPARPRPLAHPAELRPLREPSAMPVDRPAARARSPTRRRRTSVDVARRRRHVDGDAGVPGRRRDPRGDRRRRRRRRRTWRRRSTPDWELTVGGAAVAVARRVRRGDRLRRRRRPAPASCATTQPSSRTVWLVVLGRAVARRPRRRQPAVDPDPPAHAGAAGDGRSDRPRRRAGRRPARRRPHRLRRVGRRPVRRRRRAPATADPSRLAATAAPAERRRRPEEPS